MKMARAFNIRQHWLMGWPELAGFLRIDLPRFTYGGELGNDEIPVFSFHRTTPDQLRPLLEHLQRNEYVSVTLDQLTDHLTGARLCPPKSMVLTFDDGWASAWMVATPLLREFGMKAALFIPPALMKNAATPRPTLDDGITGSAAINEDSDIENYLVTWPEICAMQKSGVWEIQSHTLTHGCVWNTDQVQDFYHPRTNHKVLMNVPGTLLVDNSPQGQVYGALSLGLPLHDDSPRMDVTRRFVPDPEEKLHMAEYVRCRGGPAFFTRSSWKRELFRILFDFRKLRPGNWETEEECRAAIRNELVEARRLIESKTRRPVRHLLFPWERGNRLAVEIARGTGHHTALFGVVRGRRANRPGDDPFAIPRLSWKFIPLLPGEGRQRITANLLSRFRRRLRSAAMSDRPTANVRDISE
ncbi:putative Polysaccharide deacetylase [uncultured Woeseiaceae bacterium]|uniref:Putative Polysaccharide deacetylase n=1 Tax=uncultured Woeseiaceae bacterium TaxID=1983305 RepID=A0A7D9D1R5_9GAMM|nr:putative Polysaccharide deacetylase [uncultured Woeseiaceae bacterium]